VSQLSTDRNKLIEGLRKHPPTYLIQIHPVENPRFKLFVTVPEAIRLAMSGTWRWRGNKKGRPNRLWQIDSRRPNDFQPCYRNTAAPLDALRGIGKDMRAWKNLTTAPIAIPRDRSVLYGQRQPGHKVSVSRQLDDYQTSPIGGTAEKLASQEAAKKAQPIALRVGV
jgi:hypothetical protein